MKKFIITIDTEGDNLWAWKPGDIVKTENTLYLDRFQNLANEYGFRPVWLTNYEMMQDDRYVEFISKVEQNRAGELGMHLHAWNTPPEYDLPKAQKGQPYLIEYPSGVMEEKIAIMTETIYQKTKIKPVSHRAGRWAMNKQYFELLEKYGYKIDCSVTPHIDWSAYPGQSYGSKGSNYSSCSEQPYKIGNITEIPVTIRTTHSIIIPENHNVLNVLRAAKRTVKAQTIWLRPNGKNINEMKWLLNSVYESDADYIMFMLHSSEFMPGGSPTFRTSESIEKLYTDIRILFEIASKRYEGCTLREYEHLLKEGSMNE